MIYVMSDIHGCYDKYKSMLKKINFNEEDTLYILGDVVDRGKEGLKTLLDIVERKNIVLLRGNHDQQAGILLANLHLLVEELSSRKMAPLYQLWLSDGGNATMNEFLQLNEEQQERVIAVIRNSLISKEITVNGQIYLLAHTVPEVERAAEMETWTEDEFLMGEPDYESVYYPEKIIVTGHTPTEYIEAKSKGRMWKGNNHIAIDCGAVFGNPLGCLCLDTLEEYYVM